MELLIVSDSHGKSDRVAEAWEKQIKRPDAVCFLGDGLRDAEFFEGWGVPVYTVRGNCDWSSHWQDEKNERFLFLEGHKLLLTHGHLHDVKSGLGRIVSYAIKNGVDIIYGTLSHVFQPVTYKNVVDDFGESKNVIVAYSMGNFLSQPTVTGGQKTQQSAVLNIYIERDTEGKAYISSAECVPIYTYAKALDSAGSAFAYSILPATEYALAEEKPEIFLNESDWTNCKTAYEDMKSIVETSSANGIPLGLK